ncbi:NUDIX domain protein [[Clostridium] bifermentans ATCC 638]|uniref:NUDIX domain protein n=2 Tax=Paraclostridium bifermentans TaxID=1490 RepID=T4VTK8_PARBF|nr:NUDIX hydrolase [Paraclostridium bifermentans]EQK44793.1 NUDIX domain protein [[Clostridium] bifermentans ATCC 638] [Paraclostridium bifermentans ATCC 638 = DSM 14991]RIZ58319.1 NUDIX hydrolase [Paraclostridium bifermentans]UAG17814.1 NUDIX hydrolase [Paraclostridium bifermentans]WGX75965.1 NUDIX hydrolase [Paraclostridium bifermentans]
MILRRCAGGIVFYANKVLIVKNDKGEWTIPKGKISENDIASEVAPQKVKDEVEVEAKVLDMAGDTMYEFYSKTRHQKVCNAIMWYIMESDNTEYNINDEDITEAGFFKVKDALDMLAHNKEKSLVEISYRKFKDLKKNSMNN